MRVDYLDTVLRRLVSDTSYQPAEWSPDDIRALRELAQCIYAAGTDRDVLALRSLGLQPDSDGASGTWVAELGGQQRLLVTFKTGGGESSAEVELDMDGMGDMA